MVEWLAALQPLFLGGVLLWSGGVKVLSRAVPAAARRSALANLTGEARAPAAFRALGAAELVLALALLLPPPRMTAAAAAAGLATGFLAYLGYARVSAPESSCGCMSTRRAPITWRAFARAGLLLAAAALAMAATGPWPAALVARPVAGAAVLAASLAVVIALSPEADHRWLFPLRRLRVRLSHPLAGSAAGVPLEASLQQLHQSPAYRQVGGLLLSGLRETWDEDAVRVLCYTAEYEGRRATAVFAVPLTGHDPDAVRVALVDETDRSTLLVGGAVQPA